MVFMNVLFPRMIGDPSLPLLLYEGLPLFFHESLEGNTGTISFANLRCRRFERHTERIAHLD
eukprot:scaffold91507_cov23-Cyclotella_meneghiniana.AAC.1